MKNSLLLLLFLLCSIKFVTTNSRYNKSVFPFILQYLEENIYNSGICYIFNCWKKYEMVEFRKMLSNGYIRTAFVTSLNGIRESLTETHETKSCYVLDLSCKEFKNLLDTTASQLNFRQTFSWLILADSNNSSAKYWQKELENVKIRFDSIFRVAVPLQSTDKTSYEILDAYNPGFKTGSKPIMKNIGYWNYYEGLQINKNLSFYSDRKNMSSVIIRSASVVLNLNDISGTVHEYLLDMKTKDLDVLSKYHYNLFLLLQEIHGFSHNLTITDKWSGNSPSGIDAGVSKLLYENEVDISTTGTTQKVASIPVIDYLMPSYPQQTIFIYKNPGVYYIFSKEFLEPFSGRTWYVVLGSALVISILLKAAFWVENKYLNLGINYSWATSLLTTFSAFLQQGASISPEYFAGRLVFLVLFLLTFLLYNYYTSVLIASLLIKTPNSYSSLNKLGHSSLEIGIEDVPDSINWFKINNRSDIQRVHQRILRHDLTYNTYNIKKGLDRIREGHFAYHTFPEKAYYTIGKTFNLDEMCDLEEIITIPEALAGFMIQKKSQYSEIFHISLRKIYEAGYVHRNVLLWQSKKPECLLGSIIKTVPMKQTLITFICLIIGMLLSLILLLMEIIWSKFKLNDIFKLNPSN